MKWREEAMANLFNMRIQTEYLRFLIKRNARFMILIGIAMAVLYPLLAFTEFIIGSSYSPTVFAVGQVFLTLLLLASIFIVPFLMFSFLNSKKHLDVYHALPIRRKDLFVTSVLSAFIIVVIPFTIVFAIGGIYQVAVLDNVDTTLLWKQYYYSVIMILAILTPILFSMMNTGTSIDGLIYGVIIHAIPGIMYAAYLLFGQAILLGFTVNDPSLFLLYTSPIWSLFELVFNKTRIYPNPMLISFYWIIFGFVSSYLVLYFYQIRKSEKAENPFTNRWFFPVIVSFFTFIVQIFMYSSFYTLTRSSGIDFRTLIFPVFFTFVLYLILDVIANRGFRNLIKAMLSFAIITAISLGGFTAGALTKGIWYVTNVPNPSQVRSIELEFTDPYNVVGPAEYYSWERSLFVGSNSNKILFTNPNDIAIIVQTHKDILAEFKKIGYEKYPTHQLLAEPYPYKSSEYSYTHFKVKYTYKNGLTLSRQYEVPYEWTRNLSKLANSPVIFDIKYPAFGYINSVARFNNFTLFDVTFSNPRPLNMFTLEQQKMIAKYYKEDYIALSVNDIMYSDEAILGFISVDACNASSQCIINTLPLTAKYTKTLQYLNSLNVSLPEVVLPEKPFLIFLPNPSIKESSFFFVQGINPNFGLTYNDSYNQKINYIEVEPENLLSLLPHMRNGSFVNQAVGVVRITTSIPPGTRYSNFMFYTLSESGLAILEQLKSESVIQTTDLDILYRSE